MMMATWRGMNSGRSLLSFTLKPLLLRSPSARCALRLRLPLLAARCAWVRPSSDLEDLGFLVLDQLVDLLDELIGQGLDLLLLAVLLVLRRRTLALEVLQHRERVA